jgi:hypothetical protein
MPQIHVVDQKPVGNKLITEWLIDAGLTPTTANLPTDDMYIGSLAHTPGYDQIWELSAAGIWVEL